MYFRGALPLGNTSSSYTPPTTSPLPPSASSPPHHRFTPDQPAKTSTGITTPPTAGLANPNSRSDLHTRIRHLDRAASETHLLFELAMVPAKRITRSSGKAHKENEASENALGQSKTSDLVQVDVEPRKAAAQCEDKVEISLDQAESGKDEETHSLEIKNAIEVDDEEINDDNLAEEDLNSSEDDEIYSEESMWEDDEENSEEVNEEDTADKDENNVELQTGEDESKGDHVETEDEVKKKENAEEEKEITNGDGRKTKEPVTEKVEASLKEVDKSTGRSRKKVQPATSKKLKSTDEDNPELSRKRKAKERVDSMGMIFMCSSTTKDDCFHYRVLGLPASKKDTVEKIYPGMRLFLYDVDLKLLNGIYKAAGPGGYNIEPKAFKSQFPSQVRFKVLKDCLPIAEERFKKVIKDNYFSKNKFNCKLTSVQVKKLCKLFLTTSRGPRLTKVGRNRKAENRTTVLRGRLRVRRAEVDRFHSVKEERRYRDRSHKRQRRVSVSPVQEPLPLRVPAPLPSPVHSYARDRTLEEDAYRKYPYLEIRDPYQVVPLLSHGDPYRDRRDAPIEWRDSYRDGRDPPIERRDPYRDGREHRDFYGDRRDPPIDRHDPYRDGRDIRLERTSPYRDGRAYIDRHDPYNDRRDPYLLHRSPHRAVPLSDPYITYRRDPLSDHRDVYRDVHLVDTRDSYGRKLLPDHRDLQPHLESRRLDDISSRDSYVSYRPRPAYMEPTYSAEYPSRAGLERDLRPLGPSTDHHSARVQLSGYYSRRA